MEIVLALMLFAGQVAALPSGPPAPAPAEKSEKLRQIVVHAIRDCPVATEPDEIVVCSRDRGIAEAYRLPRLDPRYDQAAETARGSAAGSGQGLGSGDCSAIGAAGATGCALSDANSWGEWKKQRKKEGQAFPW